MRWIESAWYRPYLHPLLYLLVPLSVLFSVVTAARRLAFHWHLKRAYKAPVPVLVVGNISVGGTGKTPVVLALVEWLQQHGWKPGIVTRGYGGQGPFPLAVKATSTAAECGDEPLLLAQRSGVPVIADPNRAQAAQQLLRDFPDVNVLISDDGLQHYALQRDIELIVVDGKRGVGNGWRLPCGPLREPLKRLTKADFVLLNGQPDGPQASAIEAFSKTHSISTEARSWHRVSDGQKIDKPDGEPVTAVAAIGHPQRFFNTLLEQQIELAETASFADHHAFVPSDFQSFNRQRPLLMTEKDAGKCRAFAQRHWYYLAINARLPDAFWQQLELKLKGVTHDS
ncbi:MAG: tetraacyldisaccharide 4'-kinase [Idiomarina sp.]